MFADDQEYRSARSKRAGEEGRAAANADGLTDVDRHLNMRLEGTGITWKTPKPDRGSDPARQVGGLRPERLTGAQMDEISPGWTDRAYERAQRTTPDHS